VHHCFEISSHNMCMLYNTAAMAAAEATEATALVTAGCAALLGWAVKL
jgi:hypothetical protein